MKAQKIFENIEFKRGIGSKKSLGVGLEELLQLDYWRGYSDTKWGTITTEKDLLEEIDEIRDEYEFEPGSQNVNKRALEKAREIGMALIDIDGHVDQGVISAIIMQEG